MSIGFDLREKVNIIRKVVVGEVFKHLADLLSDLASSGVRSPIWIMNTGGNRVGVFGICIYTSEN